MKKNSLLKLGKTTLALAIMTFLTGFVGKNYFSADSAVASSDSGSNTFIMIIEFSVFMVVVSIGCFYFAFVKKDARKY